MNKENKQMLEITDWAFKFAEGEICSTDFMSEVMTILTAQEGENQIAKRKIEEWLNTDDLEDLKPLTDDMKAVIGSQIYWLAQQEDK